MISYIDEKLFLFKTKFQTRYVKRRRGVCEMHPVPLKIGFTRKMAQQKNGHVKFSKVARQKSSHLARQNIVKGHVNTVKGHGSPEKRHYKNLLKWHTIFAVQFC